MVGGVAINVLKIIFMNHHLLCLHFILLAYIFFAMLMCSILSISIISEKKTKLTRKTLIYIINFVYITMFTLHIISSFRF